MVHRIVTRFAGRCRGPCASRIPVGAPALYEPGAGIRHEACAGRYRESDDPEPREVHPETPEQAQYRRHRESVKLDLEHATRATYADGRDHRQDAWADYSLRRVPVLDWGGVPEAERQNAAYAATPESRSLYHVGIWGSITAHVHEIGTDFIVFEFRYPIGD